MRMPTKNQSPLAVWLRRAGASTRRQAVTAMLAIGLVVAGISALAWAQNASLWNPGTQPQAGMGSGNTKIPAKAAQNCATGQLANGVDSTGKFTCATASGSSSSSGGSTSSTSSSSGGPAVACYRHEFTHGIGCNQTTIRYSADSNYTGVQPTNICQGLAPEPVYAGSQEAAEKCSNLAAGACVWSAETDLGSELVIQDCTNTRANIGSCVGDVGGNSPSTAGNRHECITRITGGPGTCWLYGRKPVNAVTGAACANVDP